MIEGVGEGVSAHVTGGEDIGKGVGEAEGVGIYIYMGEVVA